MEDTIMRKVKNYRIFKETKEEMIAAGRFHPSLMITFIDKSGRHTHRLTSGYEDDIHVYRNADLTCVLSVNERLVYVGMEVFKGDDAVGDVFLQGDQVTETLGKIDLAPFTMIRRLMQYID
jgi:hypothetical protein